MSAHLRPHAPPPMRRPIHKLANKNRRLKPAVRLRDVTPPAEQENGRAVLNNFTLFAANAIVVLVMASVFFIAGRARREPYWDTWGVANLVICLALLCYMAGAHLPDALRGALPNGLLVLGISLRWRAARQFENRHAPLALFFLPLALFLVLSAAPLAAGSYPAFHMVTNVIQTAIALACAYEFWRDNDDKSLSRKGLILAYGILAATFIIRFAQALLVGDGFVRQMSLDTILTIQLYVALFHFLASSAFALTLAYERDAQKLHHLASHDGLTGLLNRRAFEAEARSFLERNPEQPFALAIFDLDHFKQINDQHGHATGDRTLEACAEAFRQTFEQSAIIARWGGEEFVALLPDLSPVEAALAVDRLRANVAAIAVPTQNGVMHPSLSAGLCYSSAKRTRDLETLLSVADSGLYAAKKRGRNRVEQVAITAA